MTATLRIRFTGFWVAGTGASRGRHLDVVTHRDRLDLPAMPMTQVKGQLRETAERLGWTVTEVADLFGSRAAARPDPLSALGHNDTQSGKLAFRGEARLPEAVRPAFSDKRTRALLFRRIAATQIDGNGVAADQTLRAIEAVVPLTLEGTVIWIGAAAPAPGWIDRLDELCAATIAFGKLKADGYGRAIAECKP